MKMDITLLVGLIVLGLVAALVAIGLIVVVFILGRKAWHKILRKKKSPTTIIEVDTIDNKRIE